MEKITVIGFGSWGIALACLLEKNGHSVIMWEPNEALAQILDSQRENTRSLPGITIPRTIKITSVAEEAAGSDVLVVVLSSKDIPDAMPKITPYLKKGQILANASKGLIKDREMRITEFLQELAPECEIACLSGPSHAEEVSRFLPTFVVAASRNIEVAQRLQNIFTGQFFRVYTSTDIIGVELGGVLKNVIALAAGVCDGLGFGDNTKAGLMTRGIAEMSRLGIAMGADEQTFAGLSGIGDLIVTCTSEHSRNRRAGLLLAQDKNVQEVLDTVNMAVEGINTAKTVKSMADKHGIDMPIVEQINKILYENKSPRDVVADLMQRDTRSENRE
ncbi:MAG: NAD(P)-dependent glycerol-3-phosphate dehydrogenase [Defluviitaleaceae bacterium]|nr:NAD(P)-dependent glycerol-3-phosphate dehydrogenase [Defluviitaleaceae bacterium]